MYLSPNCRILGSCAEVIVPALLDEIVAFGFEKLTLFARLKDSALNSRRSCSRLLSGMPKDLVIARSMSEYPGPVRNILDVSPYVPRALAVKAALLKYAFYNLCMASTARKIGISNQVCPVLPNSAGRVVDARENCEWLARAKCNKAIDHPPGQNCIHY